LLGWPRMLLVGNLANAAATAGARAMAWLGPHTPLGTSADVARQLDTGPSVFVTAVLMYLTVVHRAPIVASLTALVIIGEVAITPNLAGREHLIGRATAAILALTARLAHPPASSIGSPSRQCSSLHIPGRCVAAQHSPLTWTAPSS
jgi:hypothetical protein